MSEPTDKDRLDWLDKNAFVSWNGGVYSNGRPLVWEAGQAS